jgi:hypothetical protein
MVYGDRLAADDSLSHNGVLENRASICWLAQRERRQPTTVRVPTRPSVLRDISPIKIYRQGLVLAGLIFFFYNGVLEVDKKHDLLSVSYDIHYHAPPEDWVPRTNQFNSISLHKQRISAEGVYDPKRGILCMVGCREHNGSTDCQILVTVKLASLDARGQGHGT